MKSSGDRFPSAVCGELGRRARDCACAYVCNRDDGTLQGRGREMMVHGILTGLILRQAERRDPIVFSNGLFGNFWRFDRRGRQRIDVDG